MVASSLALARRSQAAEPKLRVGVIGHTGHGDYGHGLDIVWQRLPQTETVAVADADEAGLAAEQKKLGLATGFRDYREMLRTAKPDLVAICPRFIDEHAEMVLAAVESGAQGIYVEKPICRTPAEADRIVAACEAHGILRGSWLGLKRLARCQPWGGSGFDPVPPARALGARTPRNPGRGAPDGASLLKCQTLPKR